MPTWQEFLAKVNFLSCWDHTLINYFDSTLSTGPGLESILPLFQLLPLLLIMLRGSELVSLQQNPVDIVWGKDRPPCPHNSIFPLESNTPERHLKNKPQRLQEEITKKNAVPSVVTLLYEVVWLFYLRGTDIDFNPVFFASVDVTPMEAILFMNDAQAQHSIKTFLGSDAEIRPYESFIHSLRLLATTLGAKKDKVLSALAHATVLGDTTSLAVVEAIGQVIFQSTLLFSHWHIRLHYVNNLLLTPSDQVAQFDVALVTHLRDELYRKRDRNEPTLPPEPGYYTDGRYDIRTESVVIMREAKTPNNFGNGYLCFEHVTIYQHHISTLVFPSHSFHFNASPEFETNFYTSSFILAAHCPAKCPPCHISWSKQIILVLDDLGDDELSAATRAVIIQHFDERKREFTNKPTESEHSSQSFKSPNFVNLGRTAVLSVQMSGSSFHAHLLRSILRELNYYFLIGRTIRVLPTEGKGEREWGYHDRQIATTSQLVGINITALKGILAVLR
ncbi:hypothetical protein BDR05DRAFT_1018038 [Suillus weaverae]|nr:hypothetical protein BDR05DRAFT_1018038 [Suillus weaverae]